MQVVRATTRCSTLILRWSRCAAVCVCTHRHTLHTSCWTCTACELVCFMADKQACPERCRIPYARRQGVTALLPAHGCRPQPAADCVPKQTLGSALQGNLARFLRMAADHKRRLKFKGTLLLEPKPQVRAGSVQCEACLVSSGASHVHKVVEGWSPFLAQPLPTPDLSLTPNPICARAPVRLQCCKFSSTF